MFLNWQRVSSVDTLLKVEFVQQRAGSCAGPGPGRLALVGVSAPRVEGPTSPLAPPAAPGAVERERRSSPRQSSQQLGDSVPAALVFLQIVKAE